MISTRDLREQRASSFLNEYLQQPLPVAPPTVEMNFHGKPVTIETLMSGEAKRISIWMPGEKGRGEPLLSEVFSYDEYHQAAYEAGKKAQNHMRYADGSLMGPIDAFAFGWAEKNYRKILEAEDKRDQDRACMFPNFDPFTHGSDPVEVEHIRGEDGRTYGKLMPNKAAEKRRLEAELESTPGYGTF